MLKRSNFSKNMFKVNNFLPKQKKYFFFTGFLVFVFSSIITYSICYSQSTFIQKTLGNKDFAKLKGEYRVGIRNFPPCVMINPDNGWIRGFSIDFWDEMARRAKINYRYITLEFSDIIGGENKKSKIITGDIDIGFSGITITSNRLRKLASLHTHLATGLKIVTKKRFVFPWKQVFWALGIFFFICILMAHPMWYFEIGNEKINDKYFPGIFEAMWLVMTTISTVGYGAVYPMTILGRVWASIIMLFGTSYFSATVGALTAYTLVRNCAYEELNDISGFKVSIKKDSTAYDVIKQYTDDIVLVNNAKDAVRLVEIGEVDAALVDAPIVDYMIRQGTKVVTSKLVARQDYGFFLRKNDPNIEKLNIAMRTMIEDKTYDEIYRRWFNK